MTWKSRAKSVKVFSFDYDTIDTSNILDIHRYLKKEIWNKIMFGII